MLSHAEFQRQNPIRPLGWRWQRARHLVETGGNYCRHRDDQATGQAVEYLRALARCTTDRQRANLRQRMPDIAQAHRVHRDGGVESCVLEARVLARQSPAEIARRVLLDVDVVVAYGELFFDVRDRLEAKCFVHLQALGGSAAGKLTQQRRAKALKQLAYQGGPFVVDVAEAVLFGESSLTARDHVTVNSVPAGKVRLLVDLLTLSDDVKLNQLLDVLTDLARSTHMDGTYAESPFSVATDQLLNETRLDLKDSDLEQAGLEPAKTVESTTTLENQEAA